MSATPALNHFTVAEVGDVTVATFTDAQIAETLNIHDVGEEMNRVVAAGGHSKVLLSFAKVEFAASSLLGKLNSLQGALVARGGKLVLCDISPKLMKLFYVTKMDLALTIVPDQEAGLKAL